MELEEKYKNLKELLDLEKFPKPFLFKFIILSDEAKQKEVVACFDPKAEVKLNHSKIKNIQPLISCSEWNQVKLLLIDIWKLVKLKT